MLVQPGGAAGGAPLDPQPSVFVSDMSSNLVSHDVFHVEVLVAENGAVTGALRGRTALPSAAGVVAFTDVAVNRAGERYSLG